MDIDRMNSPAPGPSESFRGGSVQIRGVCKIDPGSGEVLPLDLLLATDALREAWDSRQRVRWGSWELSVVSPEGLIALKSLRSSGQDQDDVAFLRSIRDA